MPASGAAERPARETARDSRKIRRETERVGTEIPLSYDSGTPILLGSTESTNEPRLKYASPTTELSIVLIAVGIWLLATCYRTPRAAGSK